MSNVPPPLSPAPPTFAANPARPTWASIVAIARHQRFILWAFLGGLVAQVLAFTLLAGSGKPGAALAGLALVITLGTRVVMAVGAYKLSAALGSKVAVLWAIGTFIPNVVGLVVLIALSLKATGRLKKAGLEVGLMGAKLPDAPPPGFNEHLSDTFS